MFPRRAPASPDAPRQCGRGRPHCHRRGGRALPQLIPGNPWCPHSQYPAQALATPPAVMSTHLTGRNFTRAPSERPRRGNAPYSRCPSGAPATTPTGRRTPVAAPGARRPTTWRRRPPSAGARRRRRRRGAAGADPGCGGTRSTTATGSLQGQHDARSRRVLLSLVDPTGTSLRHRRTTSAHTGVPRRGGSLAGLRHTELGPVCTRRGPPPACVATRAVRPTTRRPVGRVGCVTVTR